MELVVPWSLVQGYKNCLTITTLENSLKKGPGTAGEWAGSRKRGLEAVAAAAGRLVTQTSLDVSPKVWYGWTPVWEKMAGRQFHNHGSHGGQRRSPTTQMFKRIS